MLLFVVAISVISMSAVSAQQVDTNQPKGETSASRQDTATEQDTATKQQDSTADQMQTTTQTTTQTATQTTAGEPTVFASVEEALTFKINAKSALLKDYNTGTVMFEKDADNKLPIASMVKIMTLLLAYEKIDEGAISADDDVVISQLAASMGGSQAFLEAGATYKLRNLLRTIVTASANDSSVAVAEHIAGSEEAFVVAMNQRAQQLGMENTVFTNATGLPRPGQYSTARDVAKMTQALLKHPLYYEDTGVWLEDFAHPTGRTTQLTNTNRLIRFYKDCDSGKTGFTSESLHCISASAKRGDMRVIAVVIAGETSDARFDAAKQMFNFAFANFENRRILSSTEALEVRLPVRNGKADKIQVIPARCVYLFSKKGEKQNYSLDFTLPNSVKAPVKKAEKVGSVRVIQDSQVQSEIDLLATQDVKRTTILDNFKRIIKTALSLRA